jgi:hypothetical protein
MFGPEPFCWMTNAKLAGAAAVEQLAHINYEI